MQLIGTSAVWMETLDLAAKAAQSRARLLLLGETGTGKDMLARYIHIRSGRAAAPFVALNCAALSPELLESELFGHAKGAFTGASRAHDGLAAAAHGGTLFLDEIAELAPALQAKLLRFVDTGEYRPVGSTQAKRADVRLIAATHQPLELRVGDGRFREDLYFRLSVLTITLPPLRARAEDIAPLARHFLTLAAAEEGKNFTGISAEAEAALSARAFAGNVRELENLIRRAVVMHEGPVLAASHLPPPRQAEAIQVSTAPRPLRLLEQEAIEAAIDYCGGNIPRAAALLEVAPSTIYRRREVN
ncbi:MAG: sigma-54 interaction domain-containing protein [Alphaproteobacteria bacterium]